MEVSKRCAAMQFSPIRRFNVFAFEAEREHGKKVYRLNLQFFPLTKSKEEIYE